MSNDTIQYTKIVDIIDEGILSILALKQGRTFPISLKDNLINIFAFLRAAKMPEFEELLNDRRITIDESSLNSIHQKLDAFEFSEQKIDASIDALKRITSKGLSDSEATGLIKHLSEISNPIWITVVQNTQYD